MFSSEGTTASSSQKVVTTQPTTVVAKEVDPKSDLCDTQMFKIKNPADECAPEDCCCCFYFLYLLFDNDNKPHEVLPKKLLPIETGTNTGPGYSYYSNMSSGSSIDSKNSFFGRYHPPSCDDNEKDFGDKHLGDEDGWKATNIPSAKESSEPEDMINLHDYNRQESAFNAGPSSNGLETFNGDDGED